MLVEDERRAAGLTEAAIGETDPIGLDELRWRGLVIVLGQGVLTETKLDSADGGNNNFYAVFVLAL